MIGNLFPDIYKKHDIAACLFIGWIYALVGMITAKILFPADPSIAAIAFTSLLIMSDSVFSKKLLESRNKSTKEAFLPYAALVFGMMLIYIVVAVAIPHQSDSLLKTQLLLGDIELDDNSLFYGIALNNIIVILIVFAFSIMMRGGGIFFLAWNSSVWGALIGASANSVAAAASLNPFVVTIGYLIFANALSLPFLLLEVFAYVNAAIAGNNINIFTRNSKKYSDAVFKDAVMMIMVSIVAILLGAYVEASIINNINPFSYFR